jgi:hypothetical protein
VDGRNNFPKLHNAMWPGLVEKGPDSEPPIGLDEMLELTAAAEVDSIKFDGVDLFLAEPHTSIDFASFFIAGLDPAIHGTAEIARGRRKLSTAAPQHGCAGQARA